MHYPLYCYSSHSSIYERYSLSWNSFSTSSSLVLSVYSNADWFGDPTDCCSTISYYFFLGDSLISWRSKKQTNFLDLALNLNIKPWRMLLQNYFGCLRTWVLLIPMLLFYIVIIVVLFNLLIMMFFTNKQNISKMIVISFVSIFSVGYFNFFPSLL